ncbi:Cytochrome p450 [Thalictrum thalictroides]|uniref:Cytochrome p450 n=1 Tax=Thalictrum thalictroides TaxID=46969 RepID=A0A7J6WT86_THATH|nr:Cytochrome p450 [Thalictrum thalictroides]
MTDPRIWDKPEEFWPERFLNNSIDFKGQDFEFIPFGLGRRCCLGINYALVVIELVLANLLQHFNWKLPQGTEREDVDMNEAFGLTMHTKIPLRLVAEAPICM